MHCLLSLDSCLGFFQDASTRPLQFPGRAREMVFEIHLSCFPRPCLCHAVLLKWLHILTWSTWTQMLTFKWSFPVVTLNPSLWGSLLGTSLYFFCICPLSHCGVSFVQNRDTSLWRLWGLKLWMFTRTLLSRIFLCPPFLMSCLVVLK